MRKLMRLVLLLSILPLAVPNLPAQERGLMASFGGATFRMDDLKGYLDYILTQYPVEGKVISAFPLFTTMSVNYFVKSSPVLKIGAGYVHTAAGAKSDYSDYSGNIHTNIKANSHRLGAFVYYRVTGSEKVDLSLFGRLDANFSRIQVGTTVSASGLSSLMIDEYKSFSPNATVGAEFLYNFKDYAIGLEGGYLVDLPGKLKNSDMDSKLRDPMDSNNILTSNWTGWRVGVKAIMWLRVLK